MAHTILAGDGLAGFRTGSGTELSVLLVGSDLRCRSHSDMNITAGGEESGVKAMVGRVKCFGMSGISFAESCER
jgi:hypothetical protein